VLKSSESDRYRRGCSLGVAIWRAANGKAVRPQPTHQAKLVMWHLMFRVPLHYAAIPEKEILNACNRFNLPLDTWRRQERAFGLLRKVYAKRAAIREAQPPLTPHRDQQFQDWPSDHETDEYFY